MAKGAGFDDKENEKGPLCHPQTRTRLLAEITQWVDDPEGKCIFWLRGAAGTGKSTISRTVAKSLANKGKLAASFFFNRTIDDCSKADLFVTTIANQLIRNVHGAQNIQGLGELIRNVIHNNPDLPSKALKTQFEELILGPLKDLQSDGSLTTALVITIDALDECDNEDYNGAGPYLERPRMIVGLLGKLASVTGIRVRVFITSRPELPIQLGFKHDVPESFHQDVALHEIPPSEIEHDIRAYLEHELKRMQSLYDISPPWPDSDTTTLLVNRCSPLFIYAATICRFMDNRRLHPKTQLKKILHSRYNSANKMEMTYGTVLEQLVHGLDECDCQDLIIQFRKIVGGIILLADPLPLSSISRLLDEPEDEVFHHLKNLHSVLSVPDDPESDQPVQMFHLSFPEYLLDRNGERGRFFIEEQQKHTDLLDCCLRVMSNRNKYCLKNDICHLEDPGVLRDEVAAEKVRKSIPQHLKYACMYWVHHLEKTDCLTNESKVYDFLSQLFVHWLEAMSWLGRIEQSVNDIRKLQAIFHSPGSKVALFMEDAGRFVVEHKYTIDRAPCQVYVSALLFSPRNSLVRQNFQSEIPKWVLRAPDIATNWNVARKSLHNYRSYVKGMCYSDDGVYLAVATENEVTIWNIVSETVCAAKDDFTSGVSCIVFRSANDVAVGLASGAVAFWDWTHGQQSIETLSDSWVAYMASSENGDMVCGFSDGAVCLWKQNLGVLHRWKTCWRPEIRDWRKQRFEWDQPVPGISYSVDGRFVAIVRDQFPNHVDVYDASSGCCVHEISVPRGFVFSSHSILPNNSLLVISGPCVSWGSQRHRIGTATRIQFWGLNGNMEAPVKEISFMSLSSLRPALNQSGMLCLQQNFEGLDIWDLREMPVLVQNFPEVHLSCFSPDGRHIAATTFGHVTIIDMLHLFPHNENTEGFQLSRGDDEKVLWSDATFSPDGSRLATISSHGRVVVWDFANGQSVPRRLEPLKPLLKIKQYNIALVWSVDGASLVAAMPDELIIYSFSSGHEPTAETYSLGLTDDYQSVLRRYYKFLCCSSHGSYLGMISQFDKTPCKIFMWKWEGRFLKHLWSKVLEPLPLIPESGLAFSPDERWLVCLVSVQQHCSLMLIDVACGDVKWATKIVRNSAPRVIAFDTAGSHIVVGGRTEYQVYLDNKVDDESDDESDDELYAELFGEVDDEMDDAAIREDDKSFYEPDRDRALDDDVYVFSVSDGGRLVHSESTTEWGTEHAKSFSVGFKMGAGPVVVAPQHWLRLSLMAEKHHKPAPAIDVSCHVYFRRVNGDSWVMKDGRRKVILPADLACDGHVQNRSSLPHCILGQNRSMNIPWLIELDCRNCMFPGSFLEMKSDNWG